jgi:SepF-like predicted cell division protein (DUF552 family)
LTVRDPYGKYFERSQWQSKFGFSDLTDKEPWIKQASKEKVPDAKGDTIHINDNNEITNNLTGAPAYNSVDVTDNADDVTTTSTPEDIVIADVQPIAPNPVTTTQSGRQIRTPAKFKDFVVYETSISSDNIDEMNNDSLHPLAYMKTGGQDNFYYHKILQEGDKDKFIEAMKNEINKQNTNQNWVSMLRSKLPEGALVITSVWAMRRKRDLCTGKIHKWKACLNVDGSKQIKGVNFWETYAPLAQWSRICLVMSMVSINQWQVKTFDFVQAFPQAPSETELYINIPKGCHVNGDRDQWCLKVVNNIYGQKQAGRV